MNLNKSTIGTLSHELIELGLVEECVPATNTRAGRPSHVLTASEKIVAIAVNPEIGAVTIGLVGLGGKILRCVRYSTQRSPGLAEAIKLSVAFVDGVRPILDGGFHVVGLGVAAPGMMHTPDGIVRLAPHFEWANEPLAEMLHDATGYPVFADNDAKLGAMAVRNFGAGRGIDDLIYLHGGASGITGGVIAGGHAVNGFRGYGGAFGHVPVAESSDVDSGGLQGTLEAEVSRRTLLSVLSLEDADPDELQRELLAAMALPAVREVVEHQIEYLTRALRSAISILNPQLIVLGGFLAALLAAGRPQLESALATSTLEASCAGMEIRTSELGTNLLLIGAAELVFDNLLNDPASVDSAP